MTEQCLSLLQHPGHILLMTNYLPMVMTPGAKGQRVRVNRVKFVVFKLIGNLRHSQSSLTSSDKHSLDPVRAVFFQG